MTTRKRAQRVGNSDQTTNSREYRQNNQRHSHRPWRFMRRVAQVVNLLILFLIVSQAASLRYIKPFVAPEGHHHQPRHVHRRQQCRHRPDEPKNLCGSGRHTEWACDPDLPKNFIFGKEAGPNWHTADCQPTSTHRQPRYRHVFAQAAHPSHVLLMMHPVND